MINKILKISAAVLIFTIAFSMTIAFASGKTFTTKGGVTYNAADVSAIGGLITAKEYPGIKPAIFIDGTLYIPQQLCEEAIGGDIAWLGKINTACVQIADGILVMKNGSIVPSIENGDANIKFVSSLSYILMPDMQFDYYWVIQKNGKEVVKSPVAAGKSSKSNAMVCEYNCTYKFEASANYTVQLYYTIHGGKTFDRVAKRIFSVR